MNDLVQIAVLLGGLFLAFHACKWAYNVGYGDVPKNVIEPVKMLSTGETLGHIEPFKAARIGEREDLTDYMTLSNFTASSSIVRMKREIETSYASNDHP